MNTDQHTDAPVTEEVIESQTPPTMRADALKHLQQQLADRGLSEVHTEKRVMALSKMLDTCDDALVALVDVVVGVANPISPDIASIQRRAEEALGKVAHVLAERPVKFGSATSQLEFPKTGFDIHCACAHDIMEEEMAEIREHIDSGDIPTVPFLLRYLQDRLGQTCWSLNNFQLEDIGEHDPMNLTTMQFMYSVQLTVLNYMTSALVQSCWRTQAEIGTLPEALNAREAWTRIQDNVRCRWAKDAEGKLEVQITQAGMKIVKDAPPAPPATATASGWSA